MTEDPDFCPNCGEKLEEQIITESKILFYCINCGEIK